MSVVAIIDDREDVRNRLAKRVKRHLAEEHKLWEVIATDPFENVADYPKWIVNEKVVILIVDERLKEVPIHGSTYSTYNGHDLVNEVRKTNKQLPIVIISAHTDDEVLEQMKGEFDDVISRTSFHDMNSSRQYVKRFIRYTQAYLENFETEYARLSALSELVALGRAQVKDVKELRALQSKLELPLSPFVSKDRNDWLAELDEKTKQLENLSQELEKLINNDR